MRWKVRYDFSNVVLPVNKYVRMNSSSANESFYSNVTKRIIIIVWNICTYKYKIQLYRVHGTIKSPPSAFLSNI